MKISGKSALKFNYFAQCLDDKRLPEIPLSPNGLSAIECFHSYESYGTLPPCRDPKLLSRALNGKSNHGITVTNCAQDYLDRLLFSREININYPGWIAAEIYSRARQLAMNQLGFVPTFVQTGRDFTLRSTR